MNWIRPSTASARHRRGSGRVNSGAEAFARDVTLLTGKSLLILYSPSPGQTAARRKLHWWRAHGRARSRLLGQPTRAPSAQGQGGGWALSQAPLRGRGAANPEPSPTLHESPAPPWLAGDQQECAIANDLRAAIRTPGMAVTHSRFGREARPFA